MSQHEKLQQVEEYNELLEAVLLSLCEDLETEPLDLLESTLDEGVLVKIGKRIKRFIHPWTGSDSKLIAIARGEQKRRERGETVSRNETYTTRKGLERQKENRKLAQQHRSEDRAKKIATEKQAEKKKKLTVAASERMKQKQPKNYEHQQGMKKRKAERQEKAARHHSSSDWGSSSLSSGDDGGWMGSI